MDEAQSTSFLEQVAGDGLDAFRASDLPKPFIKVAQKGNPEIEDRDPSYIEGLKVGNFFNTLTKEVYGASINVIVLYYEPAWLVYGANRGPFKGKYAPGSFKTTGSKYAKDKDEKLKDMEGNTVIESMIFYVINAAKPEDGIALLTLYSSSIKHAQNWVFAITHALLPSGNNAPLYGHVWNLKLEYNSNEDGSWFTIGAGNTTSVTKGLALDKLDNGQVLFDRYIKPSRQLLLDGMVKTDFNQLEDSSGSAASTDLVKY